MKTIPSRRRRSQHTRTLASQRRSLHAENRRAFEPLEGRQMLSATAYEGTFLKDINTSAASSYPSSFVAIGNEAYFAATDQAHGTQLWKSDGTAAGTSLVESQAANPSNLTNVNGTLFFTTRSASGIDSLWISGGTAATTKFVGVVPAATSVGDLTAVDSRVFFIAQVAGGEQLWESDGASLAELEAFGPSQYVSSLTAFNHKLYFSFDDYSSSPNVAKLGVSDGTPAGSTFVSTPTNYTQIGQLQTVATGGGNQTLFFEANDATNHSSLWQYDGSSAPTLVQANASPSGLTDVGGGTLYFVDTTVAGQSQLWKDAAGTLTMVTAYTPPAGQPGFANLVNAGRTLYYTRGGSFSGPGGELYAIAQTGANAGVTEDQGTTIDVYSSLSTDQSVNTSLFFQGPDNGLWLADGTLNSARELKTSDTPPKVVTIPFTFYGGLSAAAVNGKLLFAATTDTSGNNQELWSSDGTTTQQVADINPGTADSTPSLLGTVPSAIAFGGDLYFVADSGNTSTGYDLWKTDGTTSGTIFVLSNVATSSYGNNAVLWNINGNLVYASYTGDLRAITSGGGVQSLFPSLNRVADVTQVGSAWYFLGSTDNGTTYKLYSTDGTPANTKLVNVAGMPANVFNGGLATLDSQNVYFLGPNVGTPADTELYKFDGTAATAIKDLGATPSGATSYLATVGGQLVALPSEYFNASIWLSNGSAAGTQQVGFGAATPPDETISFMPVSGGIVFAGYGSSHKPTLWKIDDTVSPPTATVLSNLNPGSVSYVYPSQFEQVGNRVTFVVDASGDNQLWSTDGTSAQMIYDFKSSSPSDFTLFNGKLYFAADDGTNGSQLWSTDGTAAGTAAVTQINAGESSGGFNPANLTVIGSQLWMSGSDGTHGNEPWVSDGTTAGTVMAADLVPGGGNSNPSGFTALANGNVFVRATDGTHGAEPWALAPVPLVAVNSSPVATFTVTSTATFSHAVATFTDPNPTTSLSSYSATVNWGDGQTDTNATISGPDSNGVFTVTDSHSYAQINAGETVTVTVHRVGAPDAAPVSETVVVIAGHPAAGNVYVLSSTTAASSVSAAQGLLANAPTGSTITAATVTGQNGGTFTFNTDGSFSYTPPANFVGFDRANYTVVDSAGHSTSDSVTVLSQTGGVVWKFYEAMLDRSPEDSGLTYWIRQFNSGVPLSQLAVNFFAGDELQTRVITDYYLQYLGRAPDPSGLAYWKAKWTAAGGPEDVQAGFANSPEFTGQNGNNPADWVKGLYEKILDRPAEQQGLNYWVGLVTQLDQQDGLTFVADQIARYKVADLILKSPEEYQSIIVPSWFQQFVQQPPSASQLTTYVNELLGGTPDRTVEAQIIDNSGVANNVPVPASGTTVPLPDFYYVPLAENGNKPTGMAALTAAKDALFASLA